MQASKWLNIQLLISAEEMRQLVSDLNSTLGQFQIFLTNRVTTRDGAKISQDQFLEAYSQYVATLQSGRQPPKDESYTLFSSIWTLSSGVLKVQKIDETRQLLQLTQPAVQLQPHAMTYSREDGKFHSMSYG